MPNRRCRSHPALLTSALLVLLVSGFVAGRRAAADPAGAGATPDPARAKQVVEGLHAVMLDVMKNADELGYQGRIERLEPAIDSRYDFSFIAEKSVGRAWSGLSDEQRAKLIDAISRLAAATYAARMNAYAGERFETLGTTDASQNTLLVRSQIVQPSGKTTTLDYRLRDVNGEPRIVDVFYDGTVSELAMRRSEYSALLKKGGFPALIQALDRKIAEQAIAKAS